MQCFPQDYKEGGGGYIAAPQPNVANMCVDVSPRWVWSECLSVTNVPLPPTPVNQCLSCMFLQS